MCNELSGREGGIPLCGEVLKMGFSQGRKCLQLAKNTHCPQLPAPMWLYLQRGGPRGDTGFAFLAWLQANSRRYQRDGDGEMLLSSGGTRRKPSSL